MNLKITVANYHFTARFEESAAPITCAEFRKLLPYRQKLIHARWSGEACWIPLGDFKLDVGFENHTTEILFPYGSTCFASKMGQLAGNHFLTIIEGQEKLAEVGKLVLWHGAQDILFE